MVGTSNKQLGSNLNAGNSNSNFKSVIKELRKEIIPSVSSASIDIQHFVESVELEAEKLVEQKEIENKVLIEQLNSQSLDLKLVSEQLETITEEFESKIGLLTEEKILLENKLNEAETINYAYKLMRNSVALRLHCDKLLECKTKQEVDVVSSIIEKVSVADPKNSFTGTEKRGLKVPETVLEYLGGTSDNDSESKELERLAGINKN